MGWFSFQMEMHGWAPTFVHQYRMEMFYFCNAKHQVIIQHTLTVSPSVLFCFLRRTNAWGRNMTCSLESYPYALINIHIHRWPLHVCSKSSFITLLFKGWVIWTCVKHVWTRRRISIHFSFDANSLSLLHPPTTLFLSFYDVLFHNWVLERLKSITF